MTIRFRRLIMGMALAYVAALVVVIAFFRLVGERWWVSAVGLFLPRIGFGLPLVVLVPALLFFKLRRELWTQVVALLLVVVPLMGFTFPAPHFGSAASMRVLSFNVNSEYSGSEEVAREILARHADVVFLQESTEWSHIGDILKRTYPTVAESTQFVLATRYRLVETTDPPRIPYYQRERSPRFMRYVLVTPFGTVTFYSVHPLSPREAFNALRGQGLTHEVRSGRLFEGAHARDIGVNAGLRMLQLEHIGAMVRKENRPTIVVGDTNQPGLSAVFAEELGQLGDAFEQGGSGFGYTYPSRHPWMRIDKILLSSEFRARNFEDGCSSVSDHHCVFADVTAGH